MSVNFVGLDRRDFFSVQFYAKVKFKINLYGCECTVVTAKMWKQ